jgi:HopA1 effector protein family
VSTPSVEERNPYLADLRRIVAGVRIVSPNAAMFFGREVVAGLGPAGPMSDVHPSPLGMLLQQELYQHCYMRGSTDPNAGAQSASLAPGGEMAQDDDLTAALSAANSSRARWDMGWQVTAALPTGHVWAARGGGNGVAGAMGGFAASEARQFSPGEFITTDAAPPRPGAQITIYMPRESSTLQPGFYFAFGETPSAAWVYGPGGASTGPAADLIRFYWNLAPAGAAPFVAAISAKLNAFEVPFRLKCLSRRSLYGRADSAVLFVEGRFFRIVRELCAASHPALNGQLGEARPLFTKPVMRGVGLAEDPGGHDSFGTHRCRLIAEGLWRSYGREISSSDDEDDGRLAEVRSAFARAGLAAERPYLAPGSVDRYEDDGCDG